MRPALLRAPESELFYKGTQLGSGPGLSIRYLGTAGFVLNADDHTVVLDPFISRPGLRATMTRPLVPDSALIARHIPSADTVLVGHSHHDHILDAPMLCQQTGATLITAVDGCNVGRAAGLPEDQMITARGGDSFERGPVKIEAIASRHGRIYFGRITYAGNIAVPPPWPPRPWDLRHGAVLNWAVEHGGLRVLHIDSADFIEEHLQGHRADVVCLCAIGRKYRPNYVADVVRILQPRWIIPCHWDWFFDPFDAPEHRVLPGVDLPGFVEEITQAGAEAVVLRIGGTINVPRRESSV